MSAPARPDHHAVSPDPYQLDPAAIEQPPASLGQALRRIGPGMILAASIVGSGELIATTTLGATMGFAGLWIIVFSCLIKPVVQALIGRYSIATGLTGLAGFDKIPGPRWKVGWVVWGWAAVVFMSLFQIGAMYGGTAQTLHLLMPAIPVPAWVIVLLCVTLLLLLSGGYERVEKLATIKVCLFTALTVMCALLLLAQPDKVSLADIAGGFTFQLPGAGLATAVAVFGITGVGGTELMMYPYWCVEKGYARYTGQEEPTAAWRGRALGWIRVMHLDILFSMVVYTLATVAFYVLGAGILHPQGLNPKSVDMIPVLSNMYTQTLGPWALYLFYAGAIATLYGTIFAATAAHSRLYADLARLLGAFPATDYAARLKWRDRFVWFLSVVPVLLFLTLQSPVAMVQAGGVAQALLLPVLGGGALWLRYRSLPQAVLPGRTLDVLLWIAAVLMIGTVAASAFLAAH